MKKHSKKNKQYLKISLLLVISVVLGGIFALSVNQTPHYTARVEAASACPSTVSWGTSTVNNVQVAVANTYTAWSRLQIPAANNAYYLKIDSTCYKVVGSNLTPNQWGWVSFENGATGSVIKPSLSVGTHTIGFISSDPNVRVDKAMFISNGCVPQPATTGDNCVVTDDAAPTVSLTAPTSNTTVSGSAELTANAVDDISVSKVEFLSDGNVVGSATTSPYNFDWNLSNTAAGKHNLAAKAYDGTGHTATSNTVPITVTAPTPPPTASVYIAVPTSGDTMSGTRAVISSGTNNLSNVSKLEYYANNTDLGTAIQTNGFGWVYYWDTTKVANGSYTIVSKATNAGSTIQSDPITITVNNKSTDTQPPSAPTNLRITKRYRGGRIVGWNASTDNLGVTKYYVFLNNKLVGTTSSTSFNLSDLNTKSQYNVKVVAVDAAGNQSAAATLIFNTYNYIQEALNL